MNASDDPTTDEFGPSRSQQRRDALEIPELATQLGDAPPSRVARMELPEDVLAEVVNARRITAYGAHKRQLAYLAKIMRRYDDEDFDSARAAFGADRQQQRREAAALHHLEALRERLLDEGDAALTQLIEQHPTIDRQHLRTLIRQARSERERSKPPRASRELFRLLKALPPT
ncbi:MAG: DUF615 domain-containing protein [Xanthomonadales bacterium]|nr:DUF615 domain-containing protein [Xanthomonadales bacterium]